MTDLEIFVSVITNLEKTIRHEIMKEIFFRFILVSVFMILALATLSIDFAYVLSMPCGFIIALNAYHCVQSIKRKDIFVNRISNLEITKFNVSEIKRVSTILDYEFDTSEFSQWASHI